MECQQICKCSLADFLSREVTWQATTKRTKMQKYGVPDKNGVPRDMQSNILDGLVTCQSIRARQKNSQDRWRRNMAESGLSANQQQTTTTSKTAKGVLSATRTKENYNNNKIQMYPICNYDKSNTNKQKPSYLWLALLPRQQISKLIRQH